MSELPEPLSINKTRYFVFQVVFFGFSTLILHLALFDFFIENYREGVLSDWKFSEGTFLNWLPVIIFDMFVGIFLGLLHAVFSVGMIKDSNNVRKLIIPVNAIWLLFCFIWYFNNRGYINTEALGHVVSPFMVGIVGGLSSLLTLASCLILNRTVEAA